MEHSSDMSDFDINNMSGPLTTPSPTSAGAPTPGHMTSASRRPARKSTLTQQQKNSKRQRATQDQLLTLEIEFNKNPTPTAAVRERIADEINMTERSVQIWFQNRRAKIKNIAKKSIESGEDCNDIPESMRRYLALQAIESGKGLGRELIGRGGLAYGSGMLMASGDSTGKVVINHFACRSLSVGSWRRIGQSAMDLVVFYSPDKCCVTYYINNDGAGYKIEYPFSAIKNIMLDNGDPHSNAEGASQRPGGLIVELTRPPSFFMDSSGQGGFYQCGDFTEDQQASQIMVHHLGGHPKVLSGQLAKLIALEAFQNRHAVFEHNALAVSAPVSPIMHRPASQPNHTQNPLSVFHDTPWGVGVGLSAPRGHKRQRSRSVPIAVDFSMLRNPTNPFFIPPPPPSAPLHAPQQQLPQVPEASPYIHQPDIVAPVPQYHPAQTPLGPTLSIDTSAGYGMGMHSFGAPASATTAPSPATDFGTPAFYSAGPQQEPMTASSMMAAPFNMQFAPAMHDMSSHTPVPQPAISPMPQYVADPIIANQSPPMSSIGRSASAEFFHMPHDGHMTDESMLLADMYAKQPMQPMSLPFRTMEHEQQYPQQQQQQFQGQPNELDMAMMQAFGSTIDPSSLGQQQHHPQQQQQHHMGY